MADIEKTIKELKDGLDFKIYDNTCVLLGVSTVSNALELLKVQQPRVLAKTEIVEFFDNIVWYETKDQDNSSDYFALVEDYSLKHEAVWLQLISCDRNNRLSTADYGINWRVWSARPKDEQRKAEPWKGW